MHSTRFQIPFRKAEGREAGLKKKEKKGCIIVKEFTYTIGDPLGIHARPAGMLTKAAKVYSDTTVGRFFIQRKPYFVYTSFNLLPAIAQIFLVFMDQIKIVHIAAIEFHAQFFLDEVIQRRKIKQGEKL